MKKQVFYRDSDKDSIRKIVSDAAADRIREGVVIAVLSGNLATVQVNGSSQNQPAEIMRGLSVKGGDRVFLVRSEVVPRWFVFGVGMVQAILGNSDAASNAAAAVLLAPTSTSIIADYGLIIYKWTPSGVRSDLVYQVEYANDNIETGAVLTYVSGSVFMLSIAGGTTKYFRVRSVTNDFRVSGWTDWSNTTSLTLPPSVDILATQVFS